MPPLEFGSPTGGGGIASVNNNAWKSHYVLHSDIQYKVVETTHTKITCSIYGGTDYYSSSLYSKYWVVVLDPESVQTSCKTTAGLLLYSTSLHTNNTAVYMYMSYSSPVFFFIVTNQPPAIITQPPCQTVKALSFVNLLEYLNCVVSRPLLVI